MYSRSYGVAENDGREHQGFPVPPDYNGSMYPRRSFEGAKDAAPVALTPLSPSPQKKDAPLAEEPSPAEAPQKAAISKEMPVFAKETAAMQKAGILGGLLDKISVDDLVMFGLLILLLTGESRNNASLLTVLLAILFI